jgi:hypothetical protein
LNRFIETIQLCLVNDDEPTETAMYQIVFTSNFIRKLKESTGAVPAKEPALPAAEPVSSPRRIPGARAPRLLEALGALVYGAALRVLGAR